MLLALELLPEKNEVGMLIFPEAIATEEFSKKMMDEWRQSVEVVFPEEPERKDLPLRAGGNLLPEGFQVEREDVIQRAQTEWQFIVLSNKLFVAYRSEIEEYKDRIDQVGKFDPGLWEELKGFWDKVQIQDKEKNLFRDHVIALKEQTNELFSKMKAFRSAMDKEFQEASRSRKDYFLEAIGKIEERLAQDARLQSLFDELKELQKEFKKTKLTKGHRAKVWNKLDGTFKAVKEKKFGPEAASGGNSPLDRLNKRYDGLIQAIGRMNNSIQRDRKDKEYETRRMERTDGQLEMQIRQAKLAMIDERIRSKQAKLDDMEKTKTELERRLEKEKAREARRQEEVRKAELARELKEKIAKDIQNASDSREVQADKLEKAAAQITDSKKSAKNSSSNTSDLKEIMKAIGSIVGVTNR